MGSSPASVFFFFRHRRRRRFSIYRSGIGGSPPASALSFSHVDVGDTFQFINHIAERRNRNAGQFIGGSPTSEKY